jgi:phage-related protein
MVALPDIELGYGTQMAQDFRRKRISFGDGYSQRARDGLNNAPQVWTFTYDNIPDQQAEQLRLFFEALGGVDVIEWKPLGQATVLKWTATNFQSQPSSWRKKTCSVTLTQEFDL